MPQPELTISQGPTTTAPPPDASADDLRAALERAEADVAAFYEAAKPIADQFEAAWIHPMLSGDARRLIAVCAAEHPGELVAQLKDNDYWRIQAADVLTELHACEADAAALRYALDGTTRMMRERSNNKSRAMIWMREIVAANQGVLDRAEHPGAPLLAELAAARALRAVIQPLGGMAAVTEACVAYDAAVEARER